MSTAAHSTDIQYPQSDGQPMAENTLQFQWIVVLQGNLDAMYLNDPNVFVAGDLLWYPVEGGQQSSCRARHDGSVWSTKGAPGIVFAMA